MTAYNTCCLISEITLYYCFSVPYTPGFLIFLARTKLTQFKLKLSQVITKCAIQPCLTQCITLICFVAFNLQYYWLQRTIPAHLTLHQFGSILIIGIALGYKASSCIIGPYQKIQNPDTHSIVKGH